jgi:hypothetical protein
MSQLKKCLKPLVDIVLPEVTPLEAELSYPEHPIKVLDQKDCVTRHKTIKFFKIQWSNHTEEEEAWESEDFLRSHRLGFVFAIVMKCVIVRCSCRAATPWKSQLKISVRGEGCDTPGVTVGATVLYGVSLCTVETWIKYWTCLVCIISAAWFKFQIQTHILFLNQFILMFVMELQFLHTSVPN